MPRRERPYVILTQRSPSSYEIASLDNPGNFLLFTTPLPSEPGGCNKCRVGRNQTTVMQICDRWMQEGTTDRLGRLHPPQYTTSCEDRQIVRMAVTDRPVTSGTIAQHIESVAHKSVSARTIRRRLQQSGLSARRALIGLLLTQNHRRLC
ncbi:transposable element Tcb1 transposase [Trichonephila clavipes]|nr:transposable element Tcb1 transposase [Trichonephila clavipes]